LFVFSVRHLALGTLAAVLAAGRPESWTLAVVAVAALAAATASFPDGPMSFFAFPGWVFRALSLPTYAPAETPKLAVAWWRQGQG
jgi:hypothetical protein